MIKLSVGTADVLGLKKLTTDAPPTTAYLLAGDKCQQDCAFCPQARSSSGRADMLSRVIWPSFPKEEVSQKLCTAYDTRTLKRACFQVVNKRDALEETRHLLKGIKKDSDIPVCVSCNLAKPEDALKLMDLGVDRVGIALDAACERVYADAKGGSWQKKLRLIEEAAELAPGRISTHLIVGLGETEEEMASIMSHLITLGVTIGLFAFTPVKGTRFENRKQPAIAHYRRIQMAQYLLEQKITDLEDFTFEGGILTDFGLPQEQVQSLARTGIPFRTTGCPDCNRPYYNEKPGGTIYNYPRSLTTEEISLVLNQLGLSGDEKHAVAST